MRGGWVILSGRSIREHRNEGFEKDPGGESGESKRHNMRFVRNFLQAEGKKGEGRPK